MQRYGWISETSLKEARYKKNTLSKVSFYEVNVDKNRNQNNGCLGGSEREGEYKQGNFSEWWQCSPCRPGCCLYGCAYLLNTANSIIKMCTFYCI